MTPIEAYEKSLKAPMKKVSFWKKGKCVEIQFYRDIGDARLRAYALNWTFKIEENG